MFRKLSLLAALSVSLFAMTGCFFAASSGTYSSISSYAYYGPHPVLDLYGDADWCPITGAHTHSYAPNDDTFFVVDSGRYMFVGDPSYYVASINFDTYYYMGVHPLPVGNGWCYIDGPHRHHWAASGYYNYTRVGAYNYYTYYGSRNSYYNPSHTHYNLQTYYVTNPPVRYRTTYSSTVGYSRPLPGYNNSYTTVRPGPSTTTRPTTVRPSTTTRPSTSTTTRPSTSTTTRPSTSTTTRPSTSTPTRPSTSTVTRPSTSTPTRPSTSTPTRPSTSTVTRPSTSTPTRPSTSTPTRPSTSTSTVTRPSTSTPTRPSTSTSTVTRPSTGTSTVTRPSTSTPTRPSTSTAGRVYPTGKGQYIQGSSSDSDEDNSRSGSTRSGNSATPTRAMPIRRR